MPGESTATYQLWTSRNGPAVVVGEGVRFDGLTRGYLTRPPVLFSSAAGPSFRLGGNRRIAPSRHILETDTGETLAIFKTKRLESPFDTRGTMITDAEGDEIVSLVLRGDRFRDRLKATLKDDYLLTNGGLLAGSFGRCAPTDQAEAMIAGRCRRVLTCPADLDARIAAGILVYWLSVMEPAKSIG